MQLFGERYAHRFPLVAKIKPASVEHWSGPTEAVFEYLCTAEFLVRSRRGAGEDQRAGIVEQDQFPVRSDNGGVADPVRRPTHRAGGELDTFELPFRRCFLVRLVISDVETVHGALPQETGENLVGES